MYPPHPHRTPVFLETIDRLPIQFVEVEGHRIAYVDHGQGDPIVFIHGFGGSMWQWEHQYFHFTAQSRVVILDFLGSGLSDKPKLSYTPQLLVDFFHAFLDALHIKCVTLVGNSMGAGLCMAMAMTSPHRVKKLVLISGFPPDPKKSVASPTYQWVLTRRPPLWMAQMTNRLGGRWATESILKEIVHNPTLITPLIIERSFQNRQTAAFLAPLYSCLENMALWQQNFGSRITEIHHPTLIVWGAQDQVFPVTVGQDLHTLLPESTFQIISECGHIPQWEQPSQVNARIGEFLGQSPS